MPQFQRKLFIYFLFLFLLAGICALAQTGSKKNCGNDRLVELQRQLFPDYNRTMQENNARIRNYLQAAGSSTVRLQGSGTGLPADTVYTIPVVIHVVHPFEEAYGTGTNISYAQIRSQLEALNAAFSMSYPSYNGQWHPGYAKNAKIRFCLARNASPVSGRWATGPGGTEYGVRRYADRSGVYNHKTNMISARELADITHSVRDAYPFDQYLNIWLVKSIDGNSGTIGYATSPVSGNYPLDGIVMRAGVFGDNTAGNSFQLQSNLMQGKILAHEAGHYLNLLHIFQDGCAGTNGKGAISDACDVNGDLICDTRPTTLQNILCSDSARTTCTINYDPGTSAHDMINNYMSYADDDCMNTFTGDQVKRMHATLQLYRRNLWQAANLAATGVLGNEGCVPGYLNAAITTDKEQICAGQPVRFSNPKAGNTAVTRQWTFTGATPASGDSDTVRVVYDVPGDYTAVITVSDGTTVLTDSLRFTVLSCKLDSSLLFMSHWYFGYYAAIDFSSGTAVRSATAYTKQTMNAESAYPGQLPGTGSGVSLCDSSGNLLFYTNGVSVWNRDHVKISTGPIFGNSDINYSSRLSYIPYPGKPGKYYIAGAFPRLDKKPESIRFVLVDVAANTVTPYQEFRNPSLPPRFSSHMAVVPHCNGTDYWLIVKGKGWDDLDANCYSFIVTASGIDSTQAPVVSTGFKIMTPGGTAMQFTANRNGDKLILTTNYETALYDFDSRTGKLSNEIAVPGVNGYIDIQSGGAFSPNGQYFYIMRRSSRTQPKPYWLFQYRVSDLAYNVIPTLGHYYAYSFQLGPDNQLYILNGENYLARLADPDNWGGAKFNDRYIYFAEPPYPMRGMSGLPAFIDAKRKEPLSPDFSFQSTGCASYSFSALCFDSYTATWDFGDGTALQTGHSVTHTYAKTGEYIVKLTLSSSTRTYGSVTKRVFALPSEIHITGPDSVCAGSTFTSQYFTTAQAGGQYRWSVSNGVIAGAESRPAVTIDWSPALLDSGIVSLEVSLGSACILRASKTVWVKRDEVPAWMLPDSICLTAQSIVLSASPAGGIFIGPGINNNVFSPGIAGLGDHLLSYRYTGSCNNEIQKVITVHDPCLLIPPVTPPEEPPVRPPGIPTIPTPPVTDPDGSRDSTSIPNIFSPNNDGIHDTWRLNFLNRYPTAVVSVFDRYGALVFYSIGYTKEWDGRYKRKELPIGTYYYIIIPVAGRKPLSGSITLVR